MINTLETFSIVFYTERAIHPCYKLNIDEKSPKVPPFHTAGHNLFATHQLVGVCAQQHLTSRHLLLQVNRN